MELSCTGVECTSGPRPAPVLAVSGPCLVLDLAVRQHQVSIRTDITASFVNKNEINGAGEEIMQEKTVIYSGSSELSQPQRTPNYATRGRHIWGCSDLALLSLLQGHLDLDILHKQTCPECFSPHPFPNSALRPDPCLQPELRLYSSHMMTRFI